MLMQVLSWLGFHLCVYPLAQNWLDDTACNAHRNNRCSWCVFFYVFLRIVYAGPLLIKKTSIITILYYIVFGCIFKLWTTNYSHIIIIYSLYSIGGVIKIIILNIHNYKLTIVQVGTYLRNLQTLHNYRYRKNYAGKPSSNNRVCNCSVARWWDLHKNCYVMWVKNKYRVSTVRISGGGGQKYGKCPLSRTLNQQQALDVCIHVRRW